jgi:hypothetical protein
MAENMDDWFDELDPQEGAAEPAGDSNQPPAWASFLETRDRYERFESIVRHWFLDQSMGVVISDGIVRVKSDSHHVSQFGLSNVARICADAPDDTWPHVVAEHFEQLFRIHNQHRDLKTSIGGWPEIRPLLVARLWEPSSLAETRDSMVWREDIPGLITTIALNLNDHIRGITREEAAQWSRSDETLFETAIDNVEAMTHVEISPIDPSEPDGIHSIFAESVFVAARALRFERFTKVHGTHGSLVSLPVRHAMLAVPVSEPDRIVPSLGSLITLTRQLEQQGPGPVTSKVYWWRNRVWQEVRYELRGDQLEIAPPEELVDIIEGR